MDQVSRELAAAIADGSIASKWWFYLLLMGITALGAAIGTIASTWIAERLKGSISKQVWYTQESWKEKHRLYMSLLGEVDRVFHAAAHIQSDMRTLPLFPPDRYSTIEDGLAAIPAHKEAIDAQSSGMSRIVELSVPAEVFLSSEAIAALEPIRGTYTRITHVLNLSYYSRESLLAVAAAESKVKLLSAAKNDLRI